MTKFGFTRLVGAELFRMTHQRSNWILPLVPLAGWVVFAALTATSYGLTDTIGQATLDEARTLTDTAAIVLAMTVGAPLLLVSARAAAHDYAYGTVRLLVGGGASRANLLLAKLAAGAIVAAAALAVGLALMAGAVVVASPGLAHSILSLPATYYRELGLDVLSAAISLLACLVLGTFTSTVTRSLSAGLSAAMVWFLAENALTAVFAFLANTTHSEVFVKASGLLLAPNLDHLVQALQPWRSTVEMGARPLGETSSNPVGLVGAEQGLIVIGAWLTAFLVIALTSVVRRFDIKE
jgi:ABC-type transport system involved in multi-copper enzyme maturation permease subunit